MTTYELVTTSDAITFKANNDNIAFACAVFLGEGQAGCVNTDSGDSLETILMFVPNALEIVKKQLGTTISDFIDENLVEISEAFTSFAYTSPAERQVYDDAIAAISDPNKLKEFKEKHEDKNRSSMSQWVKLAWQYGESLIKKSKES